MSPRGIFTHVGIILHILDCLGHDMQVLYLGRAPRTKETLPDFLKWRRVTRPPTCIPRVDGKSTDPRVLGRHIVCGDQLLTLKINFSMEWAE